MRKICFLIMLFVFSLITPVQAGSISGIDVLSFNQSLNSVITDMNYDNETKIFTVSISGPTGYGWFWIMFNHSSDPSNVYSPDIVSVEKNMNATYLPDPQNVSCIWYGVSYNITLEFKSPAYIEFRYSTTDPTTNSKIPSFSFLSAAALAIIRKSRN